MTKDQVNLTEIILELLSKDIQLYNQTLLFQRESFLNTCYVCIRIWASVAKKKDLQIIQVHTIRLLIFHISMVVPTMIRFVRSLLKFDSYSYT